LQLSSKQSEIVNCSDKYAVVIAGAGSGKTRTLTERIKKLIAANKTGEKVLAITFSNKAANEINERLSQSFSKIELEEKVFIGTVHNFCMELLTSRGSTIGLSPELHIYESYEDRLEIFREALNNIPEAKAKYCGNQTRVDKKRMKELFDSLSKAKRNFKFPSDYTNRPLSQRLYQEYNDLMLAQNAIDFDDILLYAYRILTEREAIARLYQRIYKHICVDEAQDLNQAQYQVLKAIAGETATIMMVGDPNQAIYGFNGSSSQFMCSMFPKDFSVNRFELVENYRSSKAVIAAAKKIEPNFKMNGILPINGELEIYSFPNEMAEAEWIVNRINELMQYGHNEIETNPISLQQCAVIARNRYVFGELEQQLQANRIEYTVRVSANNGLNSESTFFKAFDLGLKLLMNGKDTLHLRELLELLGLPHNGFTSFDDVRSYTEIPDNITCNAFSVLKSAWDSIPIGHGSFRFDRTLDALKSYCQSEVNITDDNERLLTYKDLEVWSDRWIAFAKSTSIDDRNLASMMRSIALGIINVSKDSGLILTTVHMSKGLEFDVVFMMGMNEGVFPDYRAINNEEQMKEETHNMFVSITRSKRLCYISYPLQKTTPWGIKGQSPSRFVEILSVSSIE